MSKLILSPSGPNPNTRELSEELITIGRAPENTIHLDDPSVSGRHAQLHLVGETFHLQDLDSTNGTRVNGEAVTSVALRVGDRIQFGKVEACFDCDVREEAPPTVPALAAVDARPAELSALPADFANASPFPKRKKERDPVRSALFAITALAVLAFIASLLALAQMQPPPIP
ncbi:MAG TPA: FHA domain-containing protein [Chthoniobacterales bacterium]|jgi:predicted component of type VI protein secretion system